MSQKKVAEVLLKYNVDDSSLNKALASNSRVATSYKGMAAAAQALGLTEAQLRKLAGETDQTAQRSALLSRVWDDNTRAAQGFVTALADIQKAEAGVATGAVTAEKSVGSLTRRLEEAARVRSFQGDATGGLRDAAFGGGSAGNANLVRGLFNARQAAIALPGVGYQSPLTIGIRGLEIVADKTGASVGKLATGVGVAGIAIVAMAVALDRFQQSVAQYKAQLDGALAAQQNYYDALGTLTTEEVQKQVDELQRLRPILEAQAIEARGALESAFAQQSQGILGDASARAQDLLGISGREQLKKASDEAEAALQENVHTFARFTQGLNAGAFATNSATEAERQLEEARIRAAQQAVDAEAQFRQSLAQLFVRGSGMTTADRQAEIQQREQNINALEAYQEQLKRQREGLNENTVGYKILTGVIDELDTEINHTTREMNLLKDIFSLVADSAAEAARVEAEQLAIIQSSIAYNQQLSEQIRTSTVDQVTDRLYALQEEANALRTFLPELEKLAPTSADAARQLADARARLKEIGTDYADQMARVLPGALLRAQQALQGDINDTLAQSAARIDQINADRGEKEAAAQDSQSKAYIAAQEKRDEALNDLAEKQAEQRQKIERKANTDISNAIYARNALAAYLAQQQKKQDIADLEENGKTRQKEIDKQYAKEKQVADQRYREQLDAARSAAEKAVRIEQQKAQAEINAKVAAYNAQLSALSTFTNQGTQLVYDFANNALRALTELTNGARQAAQQPSVISTPGSFSPLPPITGTAAYNLPTGTIGRPYASGGYAGSGLIRVNDGGGVESAFNYRTNQLMMLSEPMRIFSAPMTKAMLQGGGGGVNINIPIHGTQLRKRDIERYVSAKLDDTLTKAGFD